MSRASRTTGGTSQGSVATGEAAVTEAGKCPINFCSIPAKGERHTDTQQELEPSGRAPEGPWTRRTPCPSSPAKPRGQKSLHLHVRGVTARGDARERTKLGGNLAARHLLPQEASHRACACWHSRGSEGSQAQPRRVARLSVLILPTGSSLGKHAGLPAAC